MGVGILVTDANLEGNEIGYLHSMNVKVQSIESCGFGIPTRYLQIYAVIGIPGGIYLHQ